MTDEPIRPDRFTGPLVTASYRAKHIELDEDTELPKFTDFCLINASGNPMFAPALLGKHILSIAPVANGGGKLYVYQDGVYQQGEAVLRHLIASLLGNNWKNTYANETVAWLTARAKHLDESPPADVINVRNGLLHLGKSNVKLTPHDPRILSPIQLPVTYYTNAACPKFDAFLKAIQPNDDLRNTMIEFMGLLLIPDNSYQKALMLPGPGGNGKSTFLAVVTALLGSENVSSHTLKNIAESRWAPADLYGKLANVCPDISAEELRYSGMFKSITGGDEIEAEYKMLNSFKFRPFARLIFSANDIPAARDGSKAFYDRWLVVPCTQSFRGTRAQDNNILASLTTEEELSGIFNVALAGLLRLQKRKRFLLRAAGAEAHMQFRTRADSVAGFVHATKGRYRHGAWHPRANIYADYDLWCRNEGRSPISRQRFYDRLTEVATLLAVGRRGTDGYRVVEWPRQMVEE